MRSIALIAALALTTPALAQETAGQFEVTLGGEQQTWYVMRRDGETQRSGFEGSEDEGASVTLVAQPEPVATDGQRTLTLEFQVAPGTDRPQATEASLTIGGMDGPQEAQDVTLDLATAEYGAAMFAVSGTLQAALGDRQLDGFFQATVDQRGDLFDDAGAAGDG